MVVFWIAVACIAVGLVLGVRGASIVRMSFVLAECRSVEDSFASLRQFRGGNLLLGLASACFTAGVVLVVARLLGVY